MKKVLASVLAGSMVLGMAAAASAATNLTLSNTKLNGDYRLELYKYGETRFEWNDTSIQTLFDNYKAAYAYAERQAQDAATWATYCTAVFASSLDADQNVAEAYDLLFNDVNSFLGNRLGYDAHWYDEAGITNDEPSMTAARGVQKKLPKPATVEDKLDASFVADTEYGDAGYVFENKATIDIVDENNHYMYTYGTDDAKEVKFEVVVEQGENFRVDVASGKVTVSRKRIETDKTKKIDTYEVVIKAAAGVRDFETDDFKVELDLQDANKVYFIEGEVAYSDYREVLPDERYIIKKSDRDNDHDDDGSIFDFSEVIDEETRIVCNDYVDLLFKGNYGTDFENLRVMDDDISEVEDFFQDYDIDYYDFIGTPKFAKDITVRIDADSDAYIYEYDKKTGDVVDITDECEYTSDGMTFKRKNLKTYVVLEEPYEGGNVKAEKEPVAEEPDDTDEPETETPDDKDATGSKPNPGTGAYPIF